MRSSLLRLRSDTSRGLSACESEVAVDDEFSEPLPLELWGRRDHRRVTKKEVRLLSSPGQRHCHHGQQPRNPYLLFCRAGAAVTALSLRHIIRLCHFMALLCCVRLCFTSFCESRFGWWRHRRTCW